MFYDSTPPALDVILETYLLFSDKITEELWVSQREPSSVDPKYLFRVCDEVFLSHRIAPHFIKQRQKYDNCPISCRWETQTSIRIISIHFHKFHIRKWRLNCPGKFTACEKRDVAQVDKCGNVAIVQPFLRLPRRTKFNFPKNKLFLLTSSKQFYNFFRKRCDDWCAARYKHKHKKPMRCFIPSS